MTLYYTVVSAVPSKGSSSANHTFDGFGSTGHAADMLGSEHCIARVMYA